MQTTFPALVDISVFNWEKHDIKMQLRCITDKQTHEETENIEIDTNIHGNLG